MRAVQLKFADGKPTGLWYCGRCRHIEHNVTSGNGIPCSEHHQEAAERCCTGATSWVTGSWKSGGKCTGCDRQLKACVCGRASKNCCVSCSAKLFQQEGKKVRWGADIREICYECSKKPALAAMLVDAAK